MIKIEMKKKLIFLSKKKSLILDILNFNNLIYLFKIL